MSDGRRPLDREAGFLSDIEDDLTDFQKTSKHSEVYCATVPSIDSAMSSWDSAGFDAGYGSQGETSLMPSAHKCPIVRVVSNKVSGFPVFQGLIFTKPLIYCSIRMSGDVRSPGATPALALRAWCTTRHYMMGNSQRMSGTRYLGKCTHLDFLSCQHLVLCHCSFKCI